MSLIFAKRSSSSQSSLLPARSRNVKGLRTVSDDAALTQSVGWAALMLRADLISSFPIDVFRKVKTPGGIIDMPQATPPILVKPSGAVSNIAEWMFSSQVDLDRVGNNYGIIREVDGTGKPAQIDLVDHAKVVVVVRDDVVTYRINGKTYPASEIWHERQYTLPGLAVGLSPVAYAAWSTGMWATAAEFAAEWFTNHGIVPSGILRNIEKTVKDDEADKVKNRFKVAVEGGDLFVTGKDWEYSTGPAAAAEQLFISQMEYSDQAVARFYGVPGDLVDLAVKGSAVTYANITQRNLQFLIMKLGPAVKRREDALARLLHDPWFVKLNTAALLRMDPETTSKMLIAEVAGKITAPSEARALMNRPAFTDEQIAEFAELGIVHTLAGAATANPAGGKP